MKRFHEIVTQDGAWNYDVEKEGSDSEKRESGVTDGLKTRSDETKLTQDPEKFFVGTDGESSAEEDSERIRDIWIQRAYPEMMREDEEEEKMEPGEEKMKELERENERRLEREERGIWRRNHSEDDDFDPWHGELMEAWEEQQEYESEIALSLEVDDILGREDKDGGVLKSQAEEYEKWKVKEHEKFEEEVEKKVDIQVDLQQWWDDEEAREMMERERERLWERSLYQTPSSKRSQGSPRSGPSGGPYSPFGRCQRCGGPFSWTGVCNCGRWS